VFLQAEEVAVRRGDIGADEDGLAGLEDLVVGTEADAGEVLLLVVVAGRGDGVLQDIVDGSQGEGKVEEVGQQFEDAAQRAVTDQDQAEDQLLQPGFGHGEPKEDRRFLGGGRSKGLIESVVGVVELVVNKLAADLVLVRELGDGLTRQGVQGQLLAGVGWQLPCRD
jgi:hypothetical protein